MVTAGHDIRALTTDADLRAVWPLVAQLRPDFDEERFVVQMQRQIADGCRATVLFDGNGVPRAFACWG